MGRHARRWGVLAPGREWQALTEALKDEEWAVRSHAAKSLGHTGPEAKDVVSSLNMALNDDNEFIREAARETPTSR